MTPPSYRSCLSGRQYEASIEMGETESGGNFGVDYPLALGCGQAAKSVRSFQVKFLSPLPYNPVLWCAA